MGGEEGAGQDYLTFGIWPYLTVGLLFGLTLPGVSAHGFLRGGGWGKGLYSSKPNKASSKSERELETDRERRRTSGRSDRTETVQIEKQTRKDRSRQIK